ncbi:MAG: 2'-5' RNA ligase family protein [Acidimicrobiales bacterium]|nr:2'-5' RNA ligase family protein [Acidimicrobiales bacterium]
MGHAVVVLLDDDHAREIERLWQELEDRFGVRGAQRVPYPHITLHAAASYRPAGLRAALAGLAARRAPLRVRAGGYGVFTGKERSGLVLFVPVVRSLELSELHAELAIALAGVATAVNGYYEPDHWSPHITVADRDLDPDRLAGILRWLADRPPRSWVLPVDHLAVIRQHDDHPEVELRVPFEG